MTSAGWKGVATGVLAVAITWQAHAAATPIEREPAGPVPGAELPVPVEFQLDTEIVVHDWILCVTRAFAEEIVSARADGSASARTTYGRLKDAKSCGLFPELRVILRQRVYQSSDLDHDARIFDASVNLGGNWASGFLIFGGLSVDR